MDRKQIGVKIRQLRENLNMGQKELADKVGYSAQMISAIENGKTEMTQYKAQLMAEALGVDVQELLSDSSGVLFETSYSEEEMKRASAQRIIQVYKLYMCLADTDKELLKQMISTTEEVIRNEQQ